MRLVGLTGGIGSGKSTVARMLADRGAAVIDADEIARDVLEPGTEGFRAVVDRFGDEVVGADGRLDRGRLADIVFADEQARADLNAVVHPRVGEEIARRVARYAAEGEQVVVLDVPLLVEAGQAREYDAVIVVTAPEDVRVERLVRDRGMDPADIRARNEAQAGDHERLAVATHVIDNSGDHGALEEQVDRVYRDIVGAAEERR